MKCPNCGKDAINVNGRYVCLDCGVELSPSGATTAPVAAPSMVANHTQPSLNDAMSGENPTTPPVIVPEPTPQTIPVPEPTAMPASEVPMPEVAPAVIGGIQPALEESPLPASNAPISVAITPEPMPESQSTPLQTTGPIEESVNPSPAQPVKDYYVNALNADQSEAATDLSTPNGQEGSSVLPDFPSSPPVFENDAPVTPVQTPEVPSVTTVPSLPVGDNPTLAGVPAPSLGLNQPEPLVDTAIPQQEQVVPAAPVDYFQPSSLSMTPDMTQPVTQEIPPVIAEPVLPITEAPAPIEVTPQPPIVMPPVVPLGSTPGFTPPDFSQVPVDPLDQVSPVDGIATQPNYAEPIPSNPPIPSNFPGTGSIPSTESVFGAQPPINPPVQEVVAKPRFNKKLLWIIAAIIGAILLVGGIIILVMSLNANNSSESVSQNDSGQVLTISQDVAGQMDESTDVTSTFTQSVDFSQATPKDSSQALFFSKPVDLKETWAVSKDENISLDATQASVNNKRVYIKGESTTYVYSNDTKAWVKTDGLQLSPSSAFYPIDPRGSLFYLSKVESFQNQGTGSINDVAVKKIKIIPKKTMIEDFLTAQNPAFGKIKYTDVKVDSLEILAMVDENNQIQKVTVNGSVDVTSDMFNGTVIITSSGEYKYATQTVAKP